MTFFFVCVVTCPVPSEPTKMNKDVIYGSTFGILSLMIVLSIIFSNWERRKCKWS